MAQNLYENARLYVIGRHQEWITPFDINNYVSNPPMIQKLYEEKQFAFARCLELEKTHESLTSDLNRMKMNNQALSIGNEQLHRASMYAFWLSVLGTALMGIGVNIATSKPESWIGWVILVASIVVHGVAFFVVPEEIGEVNGPN
jgi:hypothetical protein